MTRGLVVVLLMLARVAAADSPAIDQAIATAASANKRLVVELGAQWCQPCRELEPHVLTDRA